MDLRPRARAGVKYTREHLLHLVSELFFESSYVPINQITSVSKRFNSICYRASLRAFLLFNVRRGAICYIVFYLLFSNPVLVPNLSCTCPVLILYLSCTYPVLVRFPRGDYILVNNSSVVNSILAKANHFCFKCPRNLR